MNLLNYLLGAHVGFGILSLVTMDMDLWTPLAAVRDGVIDGYELVGGGEFFIGLAVVTIVLVGLRFWAWDSIFGGTDIA